MCRVKASLSEVDALLKCGHLCFPSSVAGVLLIRRGGGGGGSILLSEINMSSKEKIVLLTDTKYMFISASH